MACGFQRAWLRENKKKAYQHGTPTEYGKSAPIQVTKTTPGHPNTTDTPDATGRSMALVGNQSTQTPNQKPSSKKQEARPFMVHQPLSAEGMSGTEKATRTHHKNKIRVQDKARNGEKAEHTR